MILKIIDWTKTDIVIVECDIFRLPRHLDDKQNFPCGYWKKGSSEMNEINLKPPFSLFIMEGDKMIDSIQFCQGYEKPKETKKNKRIRRKTQKRTNN